jgi:hypothetical protein
VLGFWSLQSESLSQTAPHISFTQYVWVWGGLHVTELFVHAHEPVQVFGVELLTVVESRILLVLYSVSLRPVQKSWNKTEQLLAWQSSLVLHSAPQSLQQPSQVPAMQVRGLHVVWLIQTLNKHWPDWQVYCFCAKLQLSLHDNGSVWQI